MKRIEDVSLWIRIPLVVVILAALMYGSFQIHVLSFRFMRWYTDDTSQSN